MGISRIKTNRIFDRIFTDASEEMLEWSEYNLENANHAGDWRSRVAAFFGLPINPHTAPLSWGMFFRRMTAWHRYDSPEGQKWLNWTIVKPIVFFALNLFAIPFKFALNVFVKLPFVFLPLLAAEHLEHVFNHLMRVVKSNASLGRKIFAGLAMIPVVLFYMPLFAEGYIAHWLTSPVNSVKRLSERHPVLAGMLGVGIALTYMALAPLAIYILGPIVLAKAATVLPAALTHAIQTVVGFVSAIGNAIAPVCQFIGTYIFAGPLFHAVGLSAIQVGFGSLLGLAILTAGSLYAVASEKIARWYNSFRESEQLGFREEGDRHIHVDFTFDPGNRKLNESLHHKKHHHEHDHRHEEGSYHEHESKPKKSFWGNLFGGKKNHGYSSEVNEAASNKKRF